MHAHWFCVLIVRHPSHGMRPADHVLGCQCWAMHSYLTESYYVSESQCFDSPEWGESCKSHAAEPKAQRQEQLWNAAAAGQERRQKRCGCEQCIRAALSVLAQLVSLYQSVSGLLRGGGGRPFFTLEGCWLYFRIPRPNHAHLRYSFRRVLKKTSNRLTRMMGHWRPVYFTCLMSVSGLNKSAFTSDHESQFQYTKQSRFKTHCKQVCKLGSVKPSCCSTACAHTCPVRAH